MNYPAILVDIPVAELPDPVLDKGDPIYVTGNIDFLADDSFLRVGPFAGALLLLPTLEALAIGMTRVRRGDTRVEIRLVGDATAFWVDTPRGADPAGVSIIYRRAQTPLVSRASLDTACEGAVHDFLLYLHERDVLRGAPPHVVTLLTTVVSTWPGLHELAFRSRYGTKPWR
jgi:hypothetical protein